MKKLMTIGVAAMGTVLAASAVAQNMPQNRDQAEMAVETRQAVMHLQGWNMGPIAAMLKKQMEFDAEVVETHARRIKNLAMMVEDAFRADTRKFDMETEALDTIWDSYDEFAGNAQDLVDAAGALVKAAQSGNEGQTFQAAAAMGKACGACHDNFRED